MLPGQEPSSQSHIDLGFLLSCGNYAYFTQLLNKVYHSKSQMSFKIYKKKLFSQYCESFPDIGCGCILVSVCMCPGSLIIILI